MKVLCDMHHDALYYSLYLLFEKRLGWEFYRQIGLEWYTNNPKMWNVYDHIDTAKQFLSLDQANELPVDIHGSPLPESAILNLNYKQEDGIYYVKEPTRGYTQRAVTFDKFKEMDFDIIIASMPQHVPLFLNLRDQHVPQAKMIEQLGNAWQPSGKIPNVLISAAPVRTPPGTNVCFYHQEFDLDVFNYEPPNSYNKVYSYVHWMRNKELMNQLASLLPGFEFKRFGAGMEESITLTSDVAKTMKEMSFMWLHKPGGDGFGHNCFNSYAVGRPAIYFGSHYRGKLAEKLFEDGKTAIDAEKHGIPGTANILKNMAPEQHREMCENAYQRFKEVVDYDKEFEQIKEFLNNLI